MRWRRDPKPQEMSREQWHPYFKIFPVRIGDEIVALEWVERRGTWNPPSDYDTYASGYWSYEYRNRRAPSETSPAQ